MSEMRMVQDRASGIFLKDAAPDYDDDLVLLEGMIANSPSAWRAFVTRFDRLIYRCIAKVTRRFASVVSQDDVREIYATLQIALLANDRHKLRSFDPARGNRFSSWVGLLTVNCAYDYLRMLRREPPKEDIGDAFDLVCDVPDPFEVAADHEQQAIAAKTLEDFSDKDRTFAALYFGEGMDPNEIALRMNISVKTVYSKKHKIQSRLEIALGTSREAIAA